jgi:uncharacterized membrane protein YhhN
VKHVQFYLALFVTLAATITATLHLWPRLVRVQAQPQLYAPLTLALATLVALLSPEPVTLFYKGAITFGLLLTLVAVLFLTLPSTPPAIGFAHLLIVLFLYFLAFTSANQTGWPTPWGLLVLVYAGAVYWLLAPRLAELWGAVVSFLVLLAGMLWAAVGMGVQAGQPWALAGFAGALLLVSAGSVLALHTWRTPLRSAPTVAALLFYAGQMLIAWSTWTG